MINLPCRVTATESLLPTTDSDCAFDAKCLRIMAPETSIALAADGKMIGYAGLIPGEPGYCQGTIYLSPHARNLGEGLRAVALAVGRGGIAMARQLGYRAMAVHPKTFGQLRFARALGGMESGEALPLIPTTEMSPVLIWRFDDDADGPMIARRCMPKGFELNPKIAAVVSLRNELLREFSAGVH